MLKPESAADTEGFALTTPTVRIGQGPQNDVVLDDDTVSTSHALLELSDGAWRLTDLDSRNGTYMEGVRLAARVPTPVSANAVLAFGAVTAAFRALEDVDPGTAPTVRIARAGPGSETAVRRAGFRLPVWLLLVVLLLIFIMVIVFLSISGDAPAAAALLDSGAPAPFTPHHLPIAA